MTQAALYSLFANAYPQEVEYLRTSISSSKMDHAYCIVAPEEGAHNVCAQFFTSALLCTAEQDRPCGECISCRQNERALHPDLYQLQTAPTVPLMIEQAKEVRRHLQPYPVVASFRVVLLQDIHSITVQAANALLKTIEEPPAHAVVVLSTSQFDSLPETVRSRVQAIRLRRLSHQEVQAILSEQAQLPAEELDAYLHLMDGRFQRLAQLLGSGDGPLPVKEEMQFWVRFLQSSTADRNALISERFLRGKHANEEIHTLPTVLVTLESLIHDLFVTQQGVNVARVWQFQPMQFERLAQRYSPAAVTARLHALRRLRMMCAHNVNKKMIFDYLIFAL